MEPAGVSGNYDYCIWSISDERSYNKNETLREENPTDIHGALSEICGGSQWTVVRFLVVVVWARQWPKTRKAEYINRWTKFVADALEEDRRATCEKLSRAVGAKNRKKMH